MTGLKSPRGECLPVTSDPQKHSLAIAIARGESEGYIAEMWRGSIASCQIQNPVQLMLILCGPAVTCQSRQPTVICQQVKSDRGRKL